MLSDFHKQKHMEKQGGRAGLAYTSKNLKLIPKSPNPLILDKNPWKSGLTGFAKVQKLISYHLGPVKTLKTPKIQGGIFLGHWSLTHIP